MGLQVLPPLLLRTTRLGHLVTLNLRGNALQLLPSEFFLRLPLLQEFHANSNKLAYLPETIGVLSELRILHMKDNCLQTLPDGLFRLKNLEDLDLGYNSLVRL
ncbi:unnamed protein product, partial [Choristocarpus tenellus]